MNFANESRNAGSGRRASYNLAINNLSLWRLDPIRFVHDNFDATPDNWQAEVLRAFGDPKNNRICMNACKGPGKSTVLSWMIWNFLATRPSPKIVCTSITRDNLRDNLWAECAKWQSRSSFLSEAFAWTKERIFYKEDAANWFVSARAWSRDADEEQQAQTLAGIHADYILFILDEAGGIPDAVAAAAEGGLATGIETRIVIAGNPTHLSGPLYRACVQEPDLWWITNITGDPDDPNRAPRVSIEWARQMIQKYGRDSAWVQSGVLGQFPSQSTDALVSLETFLEAFGRTKSASGMQLVRKPKVLGCDIARHGGDLTVVAMRDGHFLDEMPSWAKHDLIATGNKIFQLYDDYEAEAIRIDDIGVGGGVTDFLARHNLPVVPVNVGEKPVNKKKYANLRAEMNMSVREDYFRKGLISINPNLKDSTTLVHEGTNLKYGFASVGQRMKIESKREFRKRVGHSPDYWDALVLAFADRVQIRGVPFF